MHGEDVCDFVGDGGEVVDDGDVVVVVVQCVALDEVRAVVPVRSGCVAQVAAVAVGGGSLYSLSLTCYRSPVSSFWVCFRRHACDCLD